MPVHFDDLKPGDIVSYTSPDKEVLRYLLYIGKGRRRVFPGSIRYVFITKQLRPSYEHEPSYETLEAFQPIDLVRHKNAILSVYDELMTEDVPNSSYVWEHLGFESPEEANLPWHHLIKIALTKSEASQRTLSLTEENMNLINQKDLFKESRGSTTLDMPPMPPTKNKGGKHQ